MFKTGNTQCDKVLFTLDQIEILVKSMGCPDASSDFHVHTMNILTAVHSTMSYVENQQAQKDSECSK